MSDELYLVTAYLTQAEYEARQQLPGMAGVIRLQAEDNDSSPGYGEEQIPRILRDAAVAAGFISRENTREFVDCYNCDRWPFMLKHLILDETEHLWTPPSWATDSEWAGSDEDARNFFEDSPELKEVFTAPPEEVARKWLANNPQ